MRFRYDDGTSIGEKLPLGMPRQSSHLASAMSYDSVIESKNIGGHMVDVKREWLQGVIE